MSNPFKIEYRGLTIVYNGRCYFVEEYPALVLTNEQTVKKMIDMFLNRINERKIA